VIVSRRESISERENSEKIERANERTNVRTSERTDGRTRVHEVGGHYYSSGGTPFWIELVAHEYPDRQELHRSISQTRRSYIGLWPAVAMTTLG